MAEGEREMTDDPNEAYEVMPIEPGPHGPPVGWWTVKRNGGSRPIRNTERAEPQEERGRRRRGNSGIR